MPTYAYTARDRAGQLINGVMSGADAAQVRDQLRQTDLYLTQIEPQKEDAQGEKSSSLFRPRSVKLNDMVVMSRQFATLISAGMPLVESLFALVAQTENPLLIETLNAIRMDVLSGSSLSTAMDRHPRVFSPFYISLVKAGESAGILEETLETAASQLDKDAELREKVRSAFLYPILVLIAAVGVVIFLLAFIVPVFARVYDQFHAKLPAVTLGLIAVSHIFTSYWWIVSLIFIGTILVIRRLIDTPDGRRVYDRLKLKLPLFGKLNRKIAIARLTRTLSAMTRAGVPILEALRTSAQTSGNVIFVEALDRVAQFVKEGSRLSTPMEQTGEFPAMVTRMIAAGEESGNLDMMLEKLTQFYERDVEYSVGRLTRMLEPALTVLIGAIVLFVLLALYMPIFNLTNVLRR